MGNCLFFDETVNITKKQLKHYVLYRNAWYSKNDIEKKKMWGIIFFKINPLTQILHLCFIFNIFAYIWEIF